jgi:alpha-L-fucosidase
MKSFPRNTICFITPVLAIMTLLPLFVNAQAPKPFGAVPNTRQIEWFHRERQVFLHFGINTFTGAEWGTGNENPSQFSPTALDCGQWMRVIRSGGFTSAILVAKHVDGFCLWPSEYTTFDVALSNWRGGNGDLVREFVDSCRAYGIKPCIYLSIHDFHSVKLGNYITYYLNLQREILQNYGKIWEIWWENSSSFSIDSATMKRYADSVRLWNSDCVIWSDTRARSVVADVRYIGTESGLRTGDPCWATEDMAFSNLGYGIPGGSIYCPAEVSSSIRPGWFWHADQDTMVNSVEVLWNKYFQSVGRNAIWTLNLPPDNRGLISKIDSARVACLNSWITGTFRTNLAEGANVATLHPRGAGYEPANLVDTAEDTYYATPDNVLTDTIVFDLGSTKTFDVLMLREVIELGHRTIGWSVDYSSDNTSFTSLLKNKQSIGYKWLEKFDPVTARYIRLNITKGQACVALNSFGLYQQQKTPADPVGIIVPFIKQVTTHPVVRIMVFDHTLELPSSFTSKPFTAELIDLSGRCLAVTKVNNANNTSTGSHTLTKITHSGLYLIKCTSGDEIAVRKYLEH